MSDATDGWTLSLVIPAYNEEAGIAAAIAEADDALAALAADYEVLIVDDGSDDATSINAEAAARSRPRVRVLRHPTNRGYGAALRTGFENARFAYVAFTDADCQFDLADLSRLVPLAAQVPLAVGYRVRRQDPWRRRFLSWGYNVLARTLLGTRVRDCDCALKVFRKEALAELLPETAGFFVNTEMLTRARQHGFAVAEVGVRHRPRLHGSSKVSLGDVPRTLRALLPFWWTRVLFPGVDRETGRQGDKEKGRHERAGFSVSPLLLVSLSLFLAASLLFFGRLGLPLQEPQEPRYAEIPRQMLAEGRFVVPVLHGQDYLDKPPLLYWLVMGSYRAFGVHDWAARLVPCLAGFLCVGATYWWGWKTVGPRAAWLGALVLCLSPRFVQLSRLVTMDGLLCLWVVLAWAMAHVAMSEGRLRPGWWFVSALACALGLLTKGPVALVLIAGPVLAYSLLDARAVRPGWRQWLVYLGVAGGLAAPWYVAAMACEPRFAAYFFGLHNVRRFVAPFDHEEPFWFYAPELLVGMLPWTLLLPAFVVYLRRWGERRPAALGFFLLASLSCLAFFSLAGCKRASYILPAVPPLALALGCYLDAVLPTKISLFSWKRRQRLAWVGGATATFFVLFAALHVVLPGYARRFSLRGQLRPLAEEIATPVACYPRRWDSVSFYLQRDDVRLYRADEREALIADARQRPRTLVFVKSERWLDELRESLPEALEFVPLGRQGFVTVGAMRPR